MRDTKLRLCLRPKFDLEPQHARRRAVLDTCQRADRHAASRIGREPCTAIGCRTAIMDRPLAPTSGRSRDASRIPIADVRIIVDDATMKALIPLALLAAVPRSAHADAIATGPFYLRSDAATADREDIIAVVASAQKQTDGTVYLCSTSASLSVGRQRQRDVRAELVASGLSSAIVRVGRRCSNALLRPPIREAAKDAVVAIVGPSGR